VCVVIASGAGGFVAGRDQHAPTARQADHPTTAGGRLPARTERANTQHADSSWFGRVMVYLHCPRCRLAIRVRADYLILRVRAAWGARRSRRRCSPHR